MTWTIEAVREADVDPTAVFALYADPDTWSTWGHNATWAEAVGPMGEGGIVRVRAGYGTVYRCRIRRWEPGRALELVVKPAGLTIVNIYEVTSADVGARVRHAFEVSGPLAPLVRPALSGMYRRKLEAEVEAVIELAAGRTDAGAERPDPTLSLPERAWHGAGKALRGGREDQGG
jgi:uncharacterized protein YndB with AHSA1/START domain